MGILDFNNEDSGFWNYSDESKGNYTPSITGDVVCIKTVQATDYNTKKPAFYDDGNPKMNIRLHIALPDDSEIMFEFKPRSMAMQAIQDGLVAAGAAGKTLSEVGGLCVTIETKPGGYNRTHPRPWRCIVHGQGKHAFRGVELFKQNQQPQQPQAQAPSPAQHAAQQAAQAWGQQPQQPQQPQAQAMPPQYSDADIPW